MGRGEREESPRRREGEEKSRPTVISKSRRPWWQVTLCDPIWLVMPRSFGMVVPPIAIRSFNHCYLLTLSMFLRTGGPARSPRPLASCTVGEGGGTCLRPVESNAGVGHRDVQHRRR